MYTCSSIFVHWNKRPRIRVFTLIGQKYMYTSRQNSVVLFILKKLKFWIIVLITCLMCLIVLHINRLLSIREWLKINWHNDAYTLFCFFSMQKGLVTFRWLLLPFQCHRNNMEPGRGNTCIIVNSCPFCCIF